MREGDTGVQKRDEVSAQGGNLGIPPVTKPKVLKMKTRYIEVVKSAKATLTEISADAKSMSEASQSADKYKAAILEYGEKMNSMRTDVSDIKEKSERILIRAYVGGFKMEDRCKGLLEDSTDKDDNMKGNPGVSCLIDNIEELILAWKEATIKLRKGVISKFVEKCNNMKKYVKTSPDVTSLDYPAFFGALHTDLDCVLKRLDSYISFSADLAKDAEDDTTDQMRKVMLLNHISLEWLYGASTATLKPFSVVMGLITEKDDSVATISPPVVERMTRNEESTENHFYGNIDATDDEVEEQLKRMLMSSDTYE
ncbi:hypothetical protein LSAT2_021933 [Lamellibrachia satsuma]|nr:hypothetical protein LSAT2_021933 [Lamellibrachia satsuma]